VGLLTLLMAVLVYTVPYATENPQDTFYILRGWLGAWFVFCLWRGWKLSWPVALCVGILEASTATCYATLTYLPGSVSTGICDAGIGAPVSMIFLIFVILAAVYELESFRGNDG
jgi:hypothetical protein